MSFSARRIITLVVVLLVSTIGGLLAIALTGSRLAAIAGVVLGVVLGAVVGVVLVSIWAVEAFDKPAHAPGKPRCF